MLVVTGNKWPLIDCLETGISCAHIEYEITSPLLLAICSVLWHCWFDFKNSGPAINCFLSFSDCLYGLSTAHYLYYCYFHSNLDDTKLPFMCLCAVKKLFSYSLLLLNGFLLGFPLSIYVSVSVLGKLNLLSSIFWWNVNYLHFTYLFTFL